MVQSGPPQIGSEAPTCSQSDTTLASPWRKRRPTAIAASNRCGCAHGGARFWSWEIVRLRQQGCASAARLARSAPPYGPPPPHPPLAVAHVGGATFWSWEIVRLRNGDALSAALWLALHHFTSGPNQCLAARASNRPSANNPIFRNWTFVRRPRTPERRNGFFSRREPQDLDRRQAARNNVAPGRSVSRGIAS